MGDLNCQIDSIEAVVDIPSPGRQCLTLLHKLPTHTKALFYQSSPWRMNEQSEFAYGAWGRGC